jgi:hypothetical protein
VPAGDVDLRVRRFAEIVEALSLAGARARGDEHKRAAVNGAGGQGADPSSKEASVIIRVVRKDKGRFFSQEGQSLDLPLREKVVELEEHLGVFLTPSDSFHTFMTSEHEFQAVG